MQELKNKKLYFVGGIVRDELLGIDNFDTDLCYEGNAIEFTKNFDVIKTNPDFGTVRILYSNKEVDIASTRTEIYPKSGHLPVVQSIGCPLIEDLKRRDFTINALAKNTETGKITDYFDGLKDLKDKKIRVLHDKSFIDDPSRILRALKFSIRFGFELDQNTKKLQDDYLNNINYDQSYHRLKKELKETFNLNNYKAFEVFIKQGIYKLLGENQKIPNLLIEPFSNIITEFKIEESWIIYMGLFDLSKFELNKKEYDIINGYNNIKNFTSNDNYEIYTKFKELPIESVLLYSISINKEIGLNYLKKLKNIKVEISGNDLINIGITEGKIYKQIFNEIIKIKINNKTFSKDDEIEFAKSFYLNNQY